MLLQITYRGFLLRVSFITKVPIHYTKMSRLFSSASALGRAVVQWFNKDKLPADFQKAAETYVANGAVKVGLFSYEGFSKDTDLSLESWRNRQNRDPVRLATRRSLFFWNSLLRLRADTAMTGQAPSTSLPSILPTKQISSALASTRSMAILERITSTRMVQARSRKATSESTQPRANRVPIRSLLWLIRNCVCATLIF